MRESSVFETSRKQRRFEGNAAAGTHLPEAQRRFEGNAAAGTEPPEDVTNCLSAAPLLG